MENRAYSLFTAIFLLGMIAGLVVAGIYLGQRGESRVPYLVTTTYSVSGLSEQADVTYKGVKVGKVERISFLPGPVSKIQIRIGVDNEAPVNTGTFARLSYQGVTGLAFIELDDEGGDSQRLATNEKDPATMPMRPSLFDEIGSSGQKLMVRVNELTEKLNLMFGAENQENIRALLANLRESSRLLIEQQRMLEPTLLALPGLAEQLQASAKKAEEVMQTADSMILAAEALAKEAQQRVKEADQVIAQTIELEKSGVHLSESIQKRTLPELEATILVLRTDMQELHGLIRDLKRNPQSLVFGAPPPRAGPGEPGYKGKQTP